MANESVHITTWGRSGAPVVMIHGSAQGSSVGGDMHFSAQKRLAGRGWKIIVPDRPGHGKSPSPGRPDDAEADGQWVAELLGESAHLVGHSFGGAVALAAAARRPQAVRSLTLIEPAMHILAAGNPAVQRHLKSAKEIYSGCVSPAELAVQFCNLVNIPDEIRGGSSEEELTRIGLALTRLKLPDGETLRRELSVIASGDIPLLVVTGGWNPGFDATGETVAGLGGGRHIVIRSEHHFPQLVSDAFNDELDAFMKRADERREAAASGASEV